MLIRYQFPETKTNEADKQRVLRLESMKEILQWRSSCNYTTFFHFPLLHPSLSSTKVEFPSRFGRVSSSLKLNCLEKSEEKGELSLTAKERRRLRNERRESSEGINWRERVEERLIKKPKKRYAKWTEELNLDNLAISGPEWWAVRVSRVAGQETAERIARLLARRYPDLEFKVYNPSVQEKRKLKDGSYSVKAKAIFPGCVFLRCIMNKEIHDFIRDVDGVGGFIGSRVGNTKKQINKPRPVSEDDMEVIFKQAKEEQLKADEAFLELEGVSDPVELILNSESVSKATKDSKPKQQVKGKGKLPKTGSTVRVVSGAFADFSGILKKFDRKNGKATIGFTILGKETLADIDSEEIAVEV